MRTLYLVLLTVTLVPLLISHGQPSPPPLPTNHRIVMQWPNSYCNIQSAQRRCMTPIPQEFKVHGLWPDVGNNKCSKTTITVREVLKFTFISDLNKYWPNLNGKNFNFWSHEWNNHGTCSMMTAEEYFRVTIQLVKGLERRLGGSFIGALTAGGLKPGSKYDPGLFPKHVFMRSNLVMYIHCNHRNYQPQIHEIHFCAIEDHRNKAISLTNCSSPPKANHDWSNTPYNHNCGTLPQGSLFPK